MVLDAHGHSYPSKKTEAIPFPEDFTSLFPVPPGLVEDVWPPTQLFYLRVYLSALGCKTIVVEDHYVDRDFIHDVALFYARSLRSYPNYCQRLHFFREQFDNDRWKAIVTQATTHAASQKFLQESYLGFAVVRPLPGSPVGRTILPTFGPTTESGCRRDFASSREYKVHLGGFQLSVAGLPFQQQDQGVSACATTALWSSIHGVAKSECMLPPTPAEITEAASRYVLADGRSLPSEGLNIQQICEATRGSGLEPLVVRSVDLEHDRAQLLGYLSSGFAPVLALQPVQGAVGHAVCAVGLKLGEVVASTDPAIKFRDASSAVRGVYIHDDRLGPYALADLGPWTLAGPSPTIATGVSIRWPDKPIVSEQSVLKAIIVATPAKLRMPISRIRGLGLALAQASADLFAEFSGRVVLNCKYARLTDYQNSAVDFGLTEGGMYELQCSTVLSRYLGLVEISVPGSGLFDVLLDATETRANPSALVFVRRSGLPEKYVDYLRVMARNCGAKLLT
jgi:hypothetical protein